MNTILFSFIDQPFETSCVKRKNKGNKGRKKWMPYYPVSIKQGRTVAVTVGRPLWYDRSVDIESKILYRPLAVIGGVYIQERKGHRV